MSKANSVVASVMQQSRQRVPQPQTKYRKHPKTTRVQMVRRHDELINFLSLVVSCSQCFYSPCPEIPILCFKDAKIAGQNPQISSRPPKFSISWENPKQWQHWLYVPWVWLTTCRRHLLICQGLTR